MKIGIIIFFLVAIVLCYFTNYFSALQDNQKNTIETFKNNKNESKKTPSQKLLNKYNITISYINPNTDSHKLLQKASEYFSYMNQPNIHSRKCATIEELIEKYSNSLEEITDQEKEIVAETFLELLPELERYSQPLFKYVTYWLNNIKFAKGKEWLEAGMPHTLDDVIIMNNSWFTNPRILTFFHELTHVHQRQRFYDYEDLYSQWGYYYYPHHIKGMENIYMLNRNNPDGTSPFWLWTRMPKPEGARKHYCGATPIIRHR